MNFLPVPFDSSDARVIAGAWSCPCRLGRAESVLCGPDTNWYESGAGQFLHAYDCLGSIADSYRDLRSASVPDDHKRLLTHRHTHWPTPVHQKYLRAIGKFR